MSKRFMVTHIDEDGGETILCHDAVEDLVVEVVVTDLIGAGAGSDLVEEDREDVLRAIAALSGLGAPHLPEQITLEDRTYRIEELPDDPVALNEFYEVRLVSPKLIKLLRRFPESKLRYTIYTNESKHPGRPHCTASRSDKSANFSIPDGERIVGDISPDEKEARETIQKHGQELLDLWYRTRPDDQKL